MSLIESSVVIFYIILHVSYVYSYSFIIAISPEVAATEEVVKVNNSYHNTNLTFPESGHMDNFDGRLKKAREKRNSGSDASKMSPVQQIAEAAQLPAIKLFRLVTLVFRNMFSEEHVNYDPPLTPSKAALPIAMLMQKGLDIIKGSPVTTTQNPDDD